MMFMLMLVLVVIIVIVVMMFMLMLVVIIVMMVVMAAALRIVTLVIIMIMMMFSVLLLKEFDSLLQGVPVLHCLQDLFAFKLIPVGGNDGSVVIMSSHKLHNCLEFILCHVLCVAQDDRRSVLHLIIVELSEVLHIYFCFFSVNYSCESVELKVGIVQSFNSFYDVAEFAHAGRFDEDPVGMELLKHLLKGLAEVSYQTAADAACVHFVDLDPGILKETAVDTDLAEFVLDENYFLAFVGFFNEFFNQSCLSCSQESAENINFCHFVITSCM